MAQSINCKKRTAQMQVEIYSKYFKKIKAFVKELKK